MAPSGAQTPAGEEFFDFEDVEARISGSPATPAIEREYASRGLIFPTGVTALIYDDTSFPPRPDLPRSPSQVITTCYSQEFCSTQINMAFDPPLERVELHVGYAGQLQQAAGVVLEVFDRSGASLGSTRATLGASDAATPASTPLSITDRTGRIAGAQVRLADETRFLSSLIVDDLTIAPFVALTRAELDPDDIELDVADEAVTTRLELFNVGNQPLTELTVEVVAGDAAAEVTASLGPGCAPTLEPGDRCPVILDVRPTEDGLVDGVLEVRANGQVVADAGVVVQVTQPTETTGSTETTDTTGQQNNTDPTTDSVTTAGGDAGTGDDESDRFPAWLVYLAGGAILGVGGRRALKGRRPPPAGPTDGAAAPDPPSPTDQTTPSPSPDVTVSPDPGRVSVDAGDRSLVARTGLATAVIAIVEGDYPGDHVDRDQVDDDHDNAGNDQGGHDEGEGP